MSEEVARLPGKPVALPGEATQGCAGAQLVALVVYISSKSPPGPGRKQEEKEMRQVSISAGSRRGC